MTTAQVDSWVAGGRRILQVPGKAVLTRKSGVGKRRLRAACCGNFLPMSEFNVSKGDLYAGGIDALTFRIVLAYVAQFQHWRACLLDIKTAFLNAPVRGGGNVHEGDEPLIVVRPPHIMVQLGLLESNHRWLVRRALYGLNTSPRDWAEHRDKVLRRLVVKKPLEASLVQSSTDDSLWFCQGGDKKIEAVVIVYVDDIAMFGPQAMLEALGLSIKEEWTISGPNWAEPESPLLFCGMELACMPYGWKITQERYLRELLSTYSIVGVATSPMAKYDEPELENLTSKGIKDTQAITGALMWSVTRSRPDLMFVTSKMSQWATKAPGRVREWGIHALQYVSTTMQLGLEFRSDPGPRFGSRDQLAVPREPEYLECYSDASHGSCECRSTQSTMVVWRGALVLWETSRQPFVTLSSAEAELVSMVHSIQVTDSVCPVIEELIGRDVVTSILGDNAAALSAFGSSSGTWRNRHLRMRARAGRERINAGVLNVTYVPGELQVADVGTKALPGSKLLPLLLLVNVGVPPGGSAEAVGAKCLGRVCSVYLRWLLSVVGGTLVGCLGISEVEVWRLRAVGRTFRYGVAFAVERAQGGGPLRRMGGDGQSTGCTTDRDPN